MAEFSRIITDLHDAVGLDPHWYVRALHGMKDLTNDPGRQQLKKLKEIIANTSAKQFTTNPDASEQEGKVLIFSPRGWNIHFYWELIIASGLRAAGFTVEFLTCGKGVHFCDYYNLQEPRGSACHFCYGRVDEILKSIPYDRRTFKEVFPDVLEQERETWEEIRDFDLDKCLKYQWDGIDLGELTKISVVRFMRLMDLKTDPVSLSVYKAFLASSRGIATVAREIASEDWDFILMVNGKFSMERIFFEVLRNNDKTVMTYERGFQRNTLVFTVNRAISDFDISDYFRVVADKPLSDSEEEDVARIEGMRRRGEDMAVNYFPELTEEWSSFKEEFSIEEGKAITVCFPNIVWDSAVIDREIGFESLWDWVKSTIDLFVKETRQLLILRLHPAEVRLPISTRTRLLDLIQAEYKDLPDNIVIVPPESGASSYTLMEHAERIIVYTSTMGLEAAMRGKEVLVTAETHYRELGFTQDISTREQYFEVLANLPQELTPRQVNRARRYAHTFFYRFSKKIKAFDEHSFMGHSEFRIHSLDELPTLNDQVFDYCSKLKLPLKEGAQITGKESI